MGHTKCVQNVMLVSQNAQLNCLASGLMQQPWSTVDVTRDAQFVKELLRVLNIEITLCDFTMNEISALIECVCVT